MRVPTFILVIILGTCGLTLVWWWWADRILRRLPGRGRWARVAVALFALSYVAGLAWFIFSRATRSHLPIPETGVALVMLWGLLGLPLIAVPLMLVRGVAGAVRWGWRRQHPLAKPPVTDGGPTVTRRQALATAAVLAPMLLTTAATAVSLVQNRRFRVRRLEVRLPQLPAALDGLTIAHVSDSHVGKFTHGPILDRIVRATNDLDAELVVFTGDLIDSSLDELPEALSFIKRLQRPERFFAIEGNHDLFGGRETFERAVRGAGVPLLLDQTASIRLRGHPVQLIGLRWLADAAAPDPAYFRSVVSRRDPEAFPILLSHHPHAFDQAVENGLPLTLAGHTHGGQLMLTPEFGAGPALFRYWSGLYEKRDARLVVSNGVGNWFPLRTNAPAEIIHLTLRRAA